LKVAVIGAGHMGRYHAEKLAKCAGVKLVAVVDADLGRAQAIARPYGCAVEDDFRKILKTADAAIVAVPTDRHHEVGLACLDAGMHVLVEKPIGRTLAEADELIGAAKARGRVLQVGHVERFNRTFRALAERMDRTLFIEAERLSGFKQRGAEVDVVLDLMIHDLDLAAALARSPVSQLSACGFRVLTHDIDIANARIEFASGCVANLSASRVSQAPVRKLRVFQPDMYASADLQGAKLRHVRQSGGVIEEIEESHGGGDALGAQAQAFVASILHGAPVQVNGESGRAALDLALQVGRLVRERLGRFG
jgi:predicted dehydrogenase